jgi:hypothetical protein
MLFRPFHIEAWFVLGASAFLANLFQHSGSLFNWNGGGWKSHDRGIDISSSQQAMDRARETVMRVFEKPMVLAGIMMLLVFALVAGLVLAWVSARAEFVFLDCVATRHARFAVPWRRYGGLGRSLFLWRAAFSFAYLAPILAFGLPFMHTVITVFTTGTFSLPNIAAMVLGASIALLLLVIIGWFSMLMNGFVVPLMYRYDEGSRAAWQRFWPLLTRHAGHFLAYGVFYIVLWIVTGIALVIAGVGTCCIGLVLMVIPYIGSVVLLPVHITARGLGPEFLAQFGEEWTVFPPLEPEEEPLIAPAPASTPPAPEPPTEPRPVV